MTGQERHPVLRYGANQHFKCDGLLVRQSPLLSPFDAHHELTVCRGIASFASVTLVEVAISSVKEIIAVMSYQGVVSLQSLQDVMTAKGQQRVIAPGSNQDIVIHAAQDNVPPVEAEQNGQDVFLLGDNISSQQRVIALVARQEISALLPEEQVF